MATTEVKLSMRISPQNRVMWEAEKRRLQFLVGVGRLSEDAAMDQAGAIIQHLTEYRTNDGPWKPLGEA